MPIIASIFSHHLTPNQIYPSVLRNQLFFDNYWWQWIIYASFSSKFIQFHSRLFILATDKHSSLFYLTKISFTIEALIFSCHFTPNQIYPSVLRNPLFFDNYWWQWIICTSFSSKFTKSQSRLYILATDKHSSLFSRPIKLSILPLAAENFSNHLAPNQIYPWVLRNR